MGGGWRWEGAGAWPGPSCLVQPPVSRPWAGGDCSSPALDWVWGPGTGDCGWALPTLPSPRLRPHPPLPAYCPPQSPPRARSVYTHPLSRCPHPVTALSAAFELPLLERHPEPPEVSAHGFTSRLPRPPPRRSDATRWKLTRHTWAWQKIEPSWNFFFFKLHHHPDKNQNALCRA